MRVICQESHNGMEYLSFAVKDKPLLTLAYKHLCIIRSPYPPRGAIPELDKSTVFWDTYKYIAENTWPSFGKRHLAHRACNMEMGITMNFVCTNSFLNGPISLAMAVLFIYIGMGKCVNSVDREVREITGTVQGIKSWLVFMERRVLDCGQNGYGMLSPFNFLSCLSNEGNKKEMCLYYTEMPGCGIVERGGNVLHIKTYYTRRPVHIRVDVNRIFSLKLSFTKLHLCSNKQMIIHCMNFMDLRIGNKSERYTTDHLPWTIISKYTSAMISVNSRDYGLHIEFEYSIAEKSNHEYTSMYGTYDPHRNYFQILLLRLFIAFMLKYHDAFVVI